MSLDSYIARQFGSPDGIGGRTVSFVMNRQNRPLYDETVRSLAPSHTDNILDIGCGNGYVLDMLARQSSCTFAGIDPSASIIRDASRRCRKFVKSGRITFQCHNVSAMPFADHSFDKAYTINTVYFWEDLGKAMREIRRVLKPNGLFINTLYSDETLSRYSHTQYGYRRFTAEQLTDAGNDAGFTVKVSLLLNGDAYCVLYHGKEGGTADEKM